MTVASETNRSGPYTGNGVTTTFNYGFRILDESHISVILTEGGVDAILVLTTDYTVSGVGDASGGQIDLGVAPTASQTITILRDVPFTQETDLENQGAYFAETIEQALDLSAMRDQQLKERLDNGLEEVIADAQAAIVAANAATAAAGDTLAQANDAVTDAEAAALAANNDAAAAAGSAAGAAAQLALFVGVYYGPLAADPALDPNGNAPGGGDMYFNTVDNVLKIFKDAVWSPIESGGMTTAATIAALKATDPAKGLVYLTDAGRSGMFAWRAGDYTAGVAADTNSGVYVKADSTAESVGAWVRVIDFQNYWSQWFGAVNDYATDNTAIINSMIVVANVQNTLSGVGTAGKQNAVRLHVEGGVKFASKNIQWLPSADWVFVYLHYWANSDTSPGAASYGTNEQLTLSVSSGYPNDGSGGWVAEDIFAAMLHPGSGVNLQKVADNSVYKHSGPTQRIQPTSSQAARASVAVIRDENQNIFRIAYEHYAANTPFSGVFFYFNHRWTELVATNVGVGAGWPASAVPVIGDVVRSVQNFGRYVVTSLATSILNCDWLSGAASPGNTLMRERAIFKGSISGNTLTVIEVLSGDGNIAVGQTILGMFQNNGITASTTITALGTGSGGVGTYTLNNAMEIAETEIVSGILSLNNIQGGGVVNHDDLTYPMQIGMDGKLYLRDTFLLRTRDTLSNAAAAATATMTNAPVAGNPTKWISIDDNGTTRRIPAW